MSKSPLSVGRTGFLACVAILGCLAVADIADQTSGDFASQQNFAETEAATPAAPQSHVAMGHVDESSAASGPRSRQASGESDIVIGDYDPEAASTGSADNTRQPLPEIATETVQ